MSRNFAKVAVGVALWMSCGVGAMAADAAAPKSEARSRSAAGADARHCLDLPTYVAIIRCAEKYLLTPKT